MLTKIFTASTIGLEAQLIEVEIDLSSSLPGIVVVGLPDKAVQESKERIRAALKQSGFEFPVGKITVNLAPADIIKTGTGFDLAIAVGILQITGVLPNLDEKILFVGELALDGRIRGVNGILTICLWARNNGFERIFLPLDNTQEASLVRGIEVFAPQNLNQLVKHLQITSQNSQNQYSQNIINSKNQKLTQKDYQNQLLPIKPINLTTLTQNIYPNLDPSLSKTESNKIENIENSENNQQINETHLPNKINKLQEFLNLFSITKQ